MILYEMQSEINLLHLQPAFEDDLTRLNRVTGRMAAWDPNETVRVKLVEWDGSGSWVYADFAYFESLSPLCLSPYAQRCLSRSLQDRGYFADTDFLCQGEPYRLFFPTRRIDAIDLERSAVRRFPDGDVWDVDRYEIRPEALRGEQVFTLEHRRSFIFVTDAFVDELNKHGLIGYKLRQVWSTETGGTDYRDVAPPPGLSPRQERAMRRRLQGKVRSLLDERSSRAAG